MADIQPPKSNWTDMIRTMLEKFIEADIPFYGSLATYAGRIFIPNAIESQTRAWQNDISSRVNELDNTVEQLSHAVRLSQLAIEIGCYVCGESQEGIVEPFEVEKIITRFRGYSEAEIYEACGELENAEVCFLSQFANSNGSLVLNADFFFVFDPYVNSWHPSLDVARLARRVVEITATEQVAVSPKLAEEFGWGPRRINPPLQMIVKYISDSRVHQGYTPPWVHMYVYATPGERAALRELAHNMVGQ
ncbi:MAG: hypothetical protein KZQ90_20770 [Candidatus Thiodiazotropha sp. (ex Codakia rugifera)]|nr:hypothetical protein [Candidatus Thiodiazotropha sp. (ex Codakia rugifera)]